MKKLLPILILLSITFQIFAQTDSCGTPDADSAILTNLPWFGNNTYLTNLRDSLHNANSCSNCRVAEGGVGQYIYQIRVRVILYYDATHRALNDDEVQWYINAVNQIYKENGFKVQLYLDKCSIFRKSSSLYAYAGNWAQMMSTAYNTDRESDKLNISLIHGWNTGTGIGPYPFMQDKYGSVVIANGTNPFLSPFTANNISSSIAHEVGHTLGLLHTFHRNHCRADCFQECVSRTRTQEAKCLFTIGKKKCSVNGDLLCDTDADPSDLSGVEWDCNSYTITDTDDADDACAIKDNYGDFWLQAPNNNALNNLMTYQHFSNVVCNQITPMQQGVMYHYIGKTSSSMKYNADVDFYENDNFYQPYPTSPENLCNVATINSKQYHAFHHSNNTACDVDWVYFQNQSSTAKPFVIQIQEVIGKPLPDTKITVFAINNDGTLGAQLAFNDNISGTNLFSKITTGNLDADHSFAIRIENNITNTSDTRSKGHYYLRVDACYDKTSVAIVGDNAICSGSKQYSVSNIPVNATVTWQATGCATVNNTGLVTKTGNCATTLKAIISACGETYEVSKDIIVGLPVFGDAGNAIESDFECSEGSNTQCYSSGSNGKVSWTTSNNMSNFTSVSWTKLWSIPASPGGSIIWSGNTTGNTNGVNVHFKSADKHIALKTTLTNTCGSLEKYYCFYSTNTPCPSGMMMMSGGNQTLKIYANPANTGSTINLELFREEEQADFENSTIQLIDSKNNVVFEKSGSKDLKENFIIPNISNGKYYVTVTNMNGTVSQELIIGNNRQ